MVTLIIRTTLPFRKPTLKKYVIYALISIIYANLSKNMQKRYKVLIQRNLSAFLIAL